MLHGRMTSSGASPAPDRAATSVPFRPNLPSRFTALAIAVPLLVYAALAARWIAAGVGYQVDEAIYVESAVFALRGGDPPPYRYEYSSWISTRGRRWPLMIIPYVGTAKAVVALPLFAAFGITAETARAVGVLLAGLGIAGVVALLTRRVHPAAGLAAGLMLAVHPSYVAFTVFDNGGASVWMASLGLLALALGHHMRRRSAASAFLLGLAGGVGAWARLNVLWLIAAAAVAALVGWRRAGIPRPAHAVAVAAGGLVGILPLLVYEAASRLATLRYVAAARRSLTWSGLLGRIEDLARTLVADPEQRIIWAGPAPTGWETALGAGLLAATAAAAALPAARGQESIARWRRAFAVTALTLAGIMATSRLNVSPHHLVGVLPLVAGALAAAAVEVAQRWGRRALLPSAAAALALALFWLNRDAAIDRRLRSTGGTRVWSTAVDDVRRYLQAHPVAPERLKILSWGFQANLYVGSGGSVHGTELFWKGSKTGSSRGRSWDSEIADGGTFLLYLFPTGDPSLDASGAGFLEALRASPVPRTERRFLDRSGSPVALLVEIMPTASRAAQPLPTPGPA